jgi:hypothetical protein
VLASAFRSSCSWPGRPAAARRNWRRPLTATPASAAWERASSIEVLSRCAGLEQVGDRRSTDGDDPCAAAGIRGRSVVSPVVEPPRGNRVPESPATGQRHQMPITDLPLSFGADRPGSPCRGRSRPAQVRTGTAGSPGPANRLESARRSPLRRPWFVHPGRCLKGVLRPSPGSPARLQSRVEAAATINIVGDFVPVSTRDGQGCAQSVAVARP